MATTMLRVGRINLTYGRYWEARSNLQTLLSRLSVFMVEAVNLELGGLKATTTPEQRKEAHMFLEELMHLTSLLFAVMMKQLRKDYNLGDLYDHETSHHVPYVDSKKVTNYWERCKAFVVYCFSLNDFFPAINTAHQEEAMPVIGGVREKELQYLESAVTGEDMRIKGGDLNGARAMAVFAIMNRKYLQRINAGGLAGNGVFQSRVFSMATDCVGVFSQCVKLAATQFPFPWAQLLMVLLCILGITLPFVVTSFMDQLWVGIIASFVIMTAFWSVNETAVELDEPFGTDPNDLPLARFVYELNQNMLTAAKQLKIAYANDDADVAAVNGSVTARNGGPVLKPVTIIASNSPSAQSTPRAAPVDATRTPSPAQPVAAMKAEGEALPAVLTWVSNNAFSAAQQEQQQQGPMAEPGRAEGATTGGAPEATAGEEGAPAAAGGDGDAGGGGGGGGGGDAGL
ncbi:hypothetical protein HXX76_000702 [Chlamydomonas incerta]|uniref:Uncharacterized protein n=1 Tax=Chlamydomonas incerta TaxID=51695 RepID=A0A835WET2_CHLIN|nr:hypothetical protein HXX76_000702 [Chlamydomonas incerta]|eukprot:KAG2446102.1 hypothetical protein HXX76_000702 [Chlamydomonas incerta]